MQRGRLSQGVQVGAYHLLPSKHTTRRSHALQKKALATHTKVKHLGGRDFVCNVSTCGSAFGYKHLLQRHVLKVHTERPQSTAEEDEDSYSYSSSVEVEAEPSSSSPKKFSIDFITGKHYLEQKRAAPGGQALVTCPYPAHFCRKQAGDVQVSACRFVFSRAYDLRRHLRAEHDEEWEKDEVDAWVQRQKRQNAAAVPPSIATTS